MFPEERTTSYAPKLASHPCTSAGAQSKHWTPTYTDSRAITQQATPEMPVDKKRMRDDIGYLLKDYRADCNRVYLSQSPLPHFHPQDGSHKRNCAIANSRDLSHCPRSEIYVIAMQCMVPLQFACSVRNFITKKCNNVSPLIHRVCCS
jgi:hypothetical protein